MTDLIVRAGPLLATLQVGAKLGLRSTPLLQIAQLQLADVVGDPALRATTGEATPTGIDIRSLVQRDLKFVVDFLDLPQQGLDAHQL